MKRSRETQTVFGIRDERRIYTLKVMVCKAYLYFEFCILPSIERFDQYIKYDFFVCSSSTSRMEYHVTLDEQTIQLMDCKN